MNFEIEKKCELTAFDYKIIKQKLEFNQEVDIKDHYLDTSDFKLAQDNVYLRMRNGLYELKIYQKFDATTSTSGAQEITNEDEIETILKEKYNITLDDVSWVMVIETHREKYSYQFANHTIIVDVDTYQYGQRYEIEVLSTPQEQYDGLSQIIEDFCSELWLQAMPSKVAKIHDVAMHQNITFFEILSQH